MNDSSTAASAALADLGRRYFTTQHTFDPYSATLLGIQDFDHLSNDPSAEASEQAAADFRAIAADLDRLPTEDLSEAELIDHQVLGTLTWGAERDAHHAQWATNASAKSYVSRQALIFQALPAMTIVNADGGDRYLARLDGVAASLTALGERYAVEAARGRIAPQVGIHHAVQQLTGYAALPLDQDVLLKPTASAAGAAVRERAERIIADSIRPAMLALAARMRDDLLAGARDDAHVGILNVPGGEDVYVDAVRRHTTTSLDAASIHQLGLDIIAEQRENWRALGLSALGTSDFDEIRERLRDDPELRFQTREQIIGVAESALARAEAARPLAFPHVDIPSCVIEEINPIDAEHAALAYYRPPAADGSRPGAHCLLTTDPSSRYSYEYEALAFHESTPGHHLQLATAQTLDIPRYRRYLDTELCGFIEGWGLYAEKLADELGLYTDDLQRLGMLSFSSLRACRLVIDTGIHHFGWSRERAMKFMWENTVTTEANVRNEVDRYIAWPGQALAYMIGRQEIVRLRSDAERSLGDRFTLPGFHGVVLGNGAVPLSVLAGAVQRWQADVISEKGHA
ncbi:DUF885 domain-containing protein [Leifsonia sp. McL0607]|uniref:DUF885 domain-containing protein n=1 Tax=Leifsonia sp. McL0607 TaxID=3415672 RepID=UPI003CFB3AB7